MKELSIEEKAKAYDEAIQRARQFIETPYLENSDDVVGYIFPELKDSEDESIRKEIIDFATKANNGVTSILANNYDFNRWLAYLEKQGEQKPVQEIEPTPIFKIGDILKRKGKDYTFRVDRIQGGYYHCDRNHGAFFPIEEQGNWELVEQKPNWSEDDEKIIQDIINDIAIVQEQVYCKSRCEDEINWLKSLKDRYTWKPSDEQMNTLEQWLKDNQYKGDARYCYPIFELLYQDLKKLKG